MSWIWVVLPIEVRYGEWLKAGEELILYMMGDLRQWELIYRAIPFRFVLWEYGCQSSNYRRRAVLLRPRNDPCQLSRRPFWAASQRTNAALWGEQFHSKSRACI